MEIDKLIQKSIWRGKKANQTKQNSQLSFEEEQSEKTDITWLQDLCKVTVINTVW